LGGGWWAKQWPASASPDRVWEMFRTPLRNDLLYWNNEKGQPSLARFRIQSPSQMQGPADLSERKVLRPKDIVKAPQDSKKSRAGSHIRYSSPSHGQTLPDGCISNALTSAKSCFADPRSPDQVWEMFRTFAPNAFRIGLCAAYRPCLAALQSNALLQPHPIKSGKCLKRRLSEVEANTFPRFGHSPHPCARAKQCFADPRSPDQVWEMFRTFTLNAFRLGLCAATPCLATSQSNALFRSHPIESGKCSGLSPRMLSGLGSARPIGLALRLCKAMLCFSLTRSSLGNV
jgi:hypothetical protein